MTKRTRERTRSFLLFRYWKILFGIVGLLDCSCYCYCYYYHHYRNVEGANSSSQEQFRRDRHRRHSRKNKSKGECDTTNGSSCTSKQKQPHFQKNQIVSSFLWQSMAFSHHPGNNNNGIISPAQTNNHNMNNTNINSKISNHDHNHNNGTRQGRFLFEDTATATATNTNTTTTAHQLLQLFLAIHLGFGFLCLVEMAVRAAEARRIVVEYQAIAALEDRIAETVAKVYRRRKLLQGQQQGRSTGLSFYSLRKAATRAIPSSLTIITTSTTTTTTRTTKLNPYLPSLSSISDTASSAAATTTRNNVHRCHHVVEDDADNNEAVKGKINDSSSGDSDADDDDDDEAMNKRNILLFLRATSRLWIPVGVTCFFWLALLPLGEYYRIVKILLFHLESCDADVSGRVHTDGGYYCVDNGGGGDWEGHTICYVDQNHLCYGSLSSPSSSSSSSPIAMTTATAQVLYLEILGDDASWATLWITTLLFRWTDAFSSMQDYLMKAVWKKYLWKNYLLAGGRGLQQRPKLVWKRLGRFLNFIKLVRFAGPLTRMVLKLSDQLVVGYSTFRNDRSAKTYRAHKLQRPSLLLRELKRIESFHKIETTIASWPSHCSMLLDTLTKEVKAPFCRVSSSTAKFYAQDFLEQSRQRGRQITRQIRWLQVQLRRGLTDFSSPEVYDNILRLSKDISLRHLDFADDKDDGHSENDSNRNENGDDSNNNNNNNNSNSNSNSTSSNNNNKETTDYTEKQQQQQQQHRRHRSSNISSWYDYLHLSSLFSSRDFLISPRSRFSVVWRITVTNCLVSFLVQNRNSLSVFRNSAATC